MMLTAWSSRTSVYLGDDLERVGGEGKGVGCDTTATEDETGEGRRRRGGGGAGDGGRWDYYGRGGVGEQTPSAMYL